MAKNAKAIAAELQGAVGDGDLPEFLALMSPLYADEVTLAHDPPLPGDGTMKGAQLAAMEEGMIGNVQKLIPDYHHEEFSATGDGDTLTVHETRVGTLPNGTVSRIPTTGVFTLQDGKITNATLHINMDDVASFMEAMSSAGIAVPTGE
jgi:ketosteroid isomerase-like protein